MIVFGSEPLRRVEFGRPGEVSVSAFFEHRSAAKIDELDFASFALKNDVLILDITVDDAAGVNMSNCDDDLKSCFRKLKF